MKPHIFSNRNKCVCIEPVTSSLHFVFSIKVKKGNICIYHGVRIVSQIIYLDTKYLRFTQKKKCIITNLDLIQSIHSLSDFKKSFNFAIKCL